MKNIIKEYNAFFKADVPILRELIKTKELKRLKHISYHCGMYYGPKDVYDIKECYTRLDHSINGAKLYYMLTEDIKGSVAFLLHDVSSPVFSHVIDFMNNDPINQEVTEEVNEKIIRNSIGINKILKKYGISIDEVVDLKKYSVGDNDRPKLCIDRLDAVLIDSLIWNPNINIIGVKLLLNNLCITKNEDGEQEIGFNNIYYGKIFMMLAIRDAYRTCDKCDTFSMNYLGSIIKKLLDNSNISEEKLYHMKEEEILRILKRNKHTKEMFKNFLELRKDQVEEINNKEEQFICYENLSKKRYINPLVNGKRITDINSFANEILRDFEIYFEKRGNYIYNKKFIRK